jgi:hypothetical protein
MKRLCIAALLLLGGLGVTTQANAGMRCTPSSCIDTQSGYYTQSHCGYNGCQPLGGVVGRVGPNGYDSAYAYDRPYVRHHRGYYGYRY